MEERIRDLIARGQDTYRARARLGRLPTEAPANDVHVEPMRSSLLSRMIVGAIAIALAFTVLATMSLVGVVMLAWWKMALRGM